MPTYEYECRACGHRFEKFQPITAAPVRKCPRCARSRARRLISAGAGVIFKGSGFYQTDYRSESYKKAAEKEKPASSAAASDAKAGPSKTATSKPAEGSGGNGASKKD